MLYMILGKYIIQQVKHLLFSSQITLDGLLPSLPNPYAAGGQFDQHKIM